MVKGFFLCVLASLGVLTIQNSQFELIQDKDGLIHFDFTNELGEFKSLPLFKSDFTLKSHIYDNDSKLLALVTMNESLSHSGFIGRSFNHITLKFVKFNQSECSFSFLYQTGFTFDRKVSIESYRFNSINKFKILGTGEKGLISFDLEQGIVSYMKNGEIVDKEMAKLNTSINSKGEFSFDNLEVFSLSNTNEREVLFN